MAEKAGAAGIGVILTGMGFDGAKGLLKMRQAGAITIGQDAQSSVVYGMPKVAYDIGAVSKQVPLEKISRQIYSILTE
ncbi:MAG: chemotaxis response regulator protein-glutamate methylesterase [Firmicutes bacterium]|nr:chemotaxis response regulator protein-glutamate methylesterase [Bacillota bacterium]